MDVSVPGALDTGQPVGSGAVRASDQRGLCRGNGRFFRRARPLWIYFTQTGQMTSSACLCVA